MSKKATTQPAKEETFPYSTREKYTGNKIYFRTLEEKNEYIRQDENSLESDLKFSLNLFVHHEEVFGSEPDANSSHRLKRDFTRYLKQHGRDKDLYYTETIRDFEKLGIYDIEKAVTTALEEVSTHPEAPAPECDQGDGQPGNIPDHFCNEFLINIDCPEVKAKELKFFLLPLMQKRLISIDSNEMKIIVHGKSKNECSQAARDIYSKIKIVSMGGKVIDPEKDTETLPQHDYTGYLCESFLYIMKDKSKNNFIEKDFKNTETYSLSRGRYKIEMIIKNYYE